MSRVADLINKLHDRRIEAQPQETEEGSYIFSSVTYKELIEALEKSKITHFEVLQDVLDIAIAHLASGLSTYIDKGGPEIPGKSLESGSGAGNTLVELIKNLLEAQAMLGTDSTFGQKILKQEEKDVIK